MDVDKITSDNFDYDVYSGGSSGDESEEAERVRLLAEKIRKNEPDLTGITGVGNVTDEMLGIVGFDDEVRYGDIPAPIIPAHNDLRDKAVTDRNSEPSAYVNRFADQPQQESQAEPDKDDEETDESFIKELIGAPIELTEHRSGHTYGRYDPYYDRYVYDEGDDSPLNGAVLWYIVWFAAGAGIPFGAFGLAPGFCIMTGAVFGLIGAIVKHNGKEGFDLRTSLIMSRAEMVLVLVCVLAGIMMLAGS